MSFYRVVVVVVVSFCPGVKSKYLETALPSQGGQVLILGGSDKGRTAKLIERDGKEDCLVELYPLAKDDSVSAWMMWQSMSRRGES